MELEVYEDVEYQQAINSHVEYPCVILEGVTSEEEVKFFKSRSVNTEISVPLYTMVDGTALHIGCLELTLDALLSLRGIFNYSVKLYKSEQSVVDINLNDVEQLIKFIRL